MKIGIIGCGTIANAAHRPSYANNPKATGHDGMDFAMLDAFFKALQNGEEAPISLRAGLAMTLPGIYAEESAKRNGEVLRMVYPWDPDWTAGNPRGQFTVYSRD